MIEKSSKVTAKKSKSASRESISVKSGVEENHQSKHTSQKRSDDMSVSKLYRSESNKMLGGVAGGLAEYFNIDATLIRLLFAFFTIFGGSGVFVYIILWVIIPKMSDLGHTNDETLKTNTEEIKEKAQQFADNMRSNTGRQNSRQFLGILVLIMGVSLLLNNFGIFRFFDLGKLWPVILIIFGFTILMRDNNER